MAGRPDKEKFLTDPAFAQDRELIEAVVEARVARATKEYPQKQKVESVWDAFGKLFSGGGSSDDDASVFDLPFLPRRK